MPDLLIRDLNPKILAGLKAAARANGRSLQAEIQDILQNADYMNRALARTRVLSRRWLKELSGRKHSDSTALVREDRDSG